MHAVEDLWWYAKHVLCSRKCYTNTMIEEALATHLTPAQGGTNNSILGSEGAPVLQTGQGIFNGLDGKHAF
jgi:hypothetical protein